MSDILTAIDKALQKTAPDPTPLTTTFLTELLRTEGGRKKNWPSGILGLDGRAVRFAETTVHAIALHVNEPLASPEEIEKLRAVQSRMEETLEQAKKYSLSRVSDHLNGIRDQMAADVSAGKPLPDVIVTPSHESVSRDFRSKQSALTGLLVKITHEEVIPLTREILKRFSLAVDDFLRETEIHDRALCEGFGLDFQPSQLWQAAASVAMRYTMPEIRTPIPGAYSTPKQMLEGVVEI
jgi:hypothetical protein